MDEHHTFVKTMTALMFEFGNLWGGPFFELQMTFFDEESSHKLVSLGYPFFLNPESKTIEILFFYRYQLAFPFMLSLMSQVVKTQNLVNLGNLPQKMSKLQWFYINFRYGNIIIPMVFALPRVYALQNSTPNISIPNILSIFFSIT